MSEEESPPVLLTSLNQVEPGMRVGVGVMHPSVPDLTLLKPGAELTPAMIARLRKLDVQQLWVEHPLTRDLDDAINPNLQRVKVGVYAQLKQGMQTLADRSLSKAHLQSYRRAVIGMVRELVTHAPFTGLADQLYDAERELISHATNVAYLAALVGLELENYLVRERPRLPERRARNIVNLGLAGMVHDIGKARLGAAAHGLHEVLAGEPGDDDAYREHVRAGYDQLRETEVPPTVRHVVRAHHRRFDGSGWPDLGHPHRPEPEGRRLHIFARIVSAVNVLDALLWDAEGGRRPPVAALHDFASARFDGWFDPIVRSAVLHRIPPFGVGSQVELSDGRQAVVVEPAEYQPCRPRIRPLEETGSSGEPPPVMSLEEYPDLEIVSCAGVDVRPWRFRVAPPPHGRAA